MGEGFSSRKQTTTQLQYSIFHDRHLASQPVQKSTISLPVEFRLGGIRPALASEAIRYS
jgi:hypothetical protein